MKTAKFKPSQWNQYMIPHANISKCFSCSFWTKIVVLYVAVAVLAAESTSADTVVIGTRVYQRTEQYLGSGDSYGNAQGNLTVLANGNFMVSWDQGTPTDCYGQLFNPGGTNIGSAFVLDPNNSYGWHYGPVTAPLPGGGFAVSWGDSSAVANVQLFNSSPAATGGQFTALQVDAWPAIDSYTNGDFVVAGFAVNSGEVNTPVYATRFNSSGIAYSNTFQVDLETNGLGCPSVSYGTDGRFAIAWLSQASGNNVMARAYQSNQFSPFGPEFVVNSSPPTTQSRSYPTARYNADDDLIVAWGGYGESSSNGVFARTFDTNVMPEGNEWQVNQNAVGEDYVSLGIGPTNQMFFCWTSTNDVYARVFNESGAPMGNEFRINQFTGSGSRYINWNGGLHNNAMLANGNLVVSWVGTGASGFGVYLTTLQFLYDAAITIVSQPTNQIVAPQATASFSVTASSALPLGYQWQMNGTNLLPNARISGVNSPNLIISDVQASDAGNYEVIVTNSITAVTSAPPAVLTVSSAPSFVTEPQSITNLSGTNVTLTASATGTGPLSYQWLFDGTNLLGATNNSFALEDAQTTNSGYYSVIITNVAGAITSAVAAVSIVPFLATHSGIAYQSPGTCVISGRIGWAWDQSLLFLVIEPNLPNGWTLLSASGQGNPEVEDGKIVFDESTAPNPLNFSYTAAVPSGQTGTQAIQDTAIYFLEDMEQTASLQAAANPLFLNYGFFISSPTIQSNTLTFNFYGDTGSNYVIQASPDLVHWTNLMSIIPADGLFQTNLPATNDQMFFRTMLEP